MKEDDAYLTFMSETLIGLEKCHNDLEDKN